MSLLDCQNLTAAYAQREIFHDVTFRVEPADRIGLIGANGSGKTTLFQILRGALEPTEGSVFLSSGVRLGSVEQHACADSALTVYEELLTVFRELSEMEAEIAEIDRRVEQTAGEDPALLDRQAELHERFRANGGLTYTARTRSALMGLGFSQAETQLPVAALSGGQRTKLSLGKLLLSAPDLMLLDEPTNHLDIKSVEWLEDFLSKSAGAFIVISHDRYFLDKVTRKTMELRGRRLYVGKGSYSVFVKNRALQLESDRREYEKGVTEIRRIEKIIEQQKQFNQERNYVTIASKEKQIERIRASLPELPPRELSFRLRFGEVERAGDIVLYTENLTKRYDGVTLFSGVSFTVRREERVFLLGPNGCGKSTLLSVIMKQIRPDEGFSRFGQNVRVGYFSQTQEGLTGDNTVIGELYDRFPRLTIPELRNLLGGFLFRNDDIEKRMRDLSGGERARIALLILILKSPNFLILDEPTNHLDAASRETLEEALSAYEGTLLCVSHDRYFVNRLASRILSFDGSRIVSTQGNYDDYVATLRSESSEAREPARQQKKPDAYAERKEREREQRRLASRIAKIEAELEEIGAEKEKIAETLALPEVSADYEQVLSLTARLDALHEREQALETEWLELNVTPSQ